jgi:hypothetical protein
MYLKITNKEELHHGLQYHDGLVKDFRKFRKTGTCTGGIYFTTPEFICNFLDYGPWIREVKIPEDAEMIPDPSLIGDKWRASKVILSPRKRLSEVATWKWLIESGVDIHAGNDYTLLKSDFALILSAYNGYLKLVKYLVEQGANIHAENDYAVKVAAKQGHFGIVEFLTSKGI